jgi:hypothetical protein
MRHHLTRFFVAAVGGAGVLLAGAGAAAASPAAAAHAAPAHSGWGKAAEIPGSGKLAAGGDANGNSVSCSSAGNCVVGGFYIDTKRHDQVYLAVERKGRWGKAFEIPGTPSLNGGGDADLAAVACPSAGNCTATGSYAASAGPLEAFVVSERGGHWAKAAEVRGFGTLNADDYGQVKALSCAAAGYCAVGGSYLDGSDNQQAFLATERAGHWAAAVKVPGIAALNSGGRSQVTEISCRKRGYCTAGGYTQRSGTVSTAFVLSEVKGHWGNAQRLPGMSGINHGGVAGLDALSCASPGNCAAGGSYRPSTVSTHSQAWLAVQKSGHWGNAFEAAGSLNAGGGAQLTAASCPAAGACVAGGYYENAAGRLELFLISQHQGHWGKAGKLPGLLTLNKGPDSQLYSLSCSSAGNCSGGGYYNNATFREFAFVSTESGGHWAAAKRVPGITSVSPGGDSGVSQVSCLSAGHCAATGYGTDGSHHGLAYVVSRT